MGEAADETLLGRMDGDTKDSIEILGCYKNAKISLTISSM